MLKKLLFGIEGVVLAALLTACAAAPSLSVVLVPVACFIAYFLSTVFGAWVLPVAAAVNVTLSSVFGTFGIFSVCAAVLMVLLTVPCALRGKISVICETALCAAAGLIAVCSCFGIYALVCRSSVADAVVGVYSDLGADPVASFIAQKRYDALTEEKLGYVPFLPSDELYSADALRVFAENIGSELDGSVLWYLSGFGAFAGGLACICSTALAQASGCETRLPKVKDVRLGHVYLKVSVIPALIFALLYVYEPMRPVVRSVVNVAITLPTTLCGITLLYHSLDRVRGKPKIVALVGFWLIMAVSAFFYEWGLLIFGFVGLADCVINVRKLLDWALS